MEGSRGPKKGLDISVGLELPLSLYFFLSWAVLCSQELCPGIAYIPHQATPPQYKCILEGGPLPDEMLGIDDGPLQSAIADKPQRVNRRSAGLDESEHAQALLDELNAEAAADFDVEDVLLQMAIAEGYVSPEQVEEDVEVLPVAPDLQGDAPDEPQDDTAVEQPSGDRTEWRKHDRYDVDIRGDGRAHLRHDTVRHILSAHCGLKSHGAYCRVNRTLKHENARKDAQGRPAGFLVQWMACANDFATSALHMQESRWPGCLASDQFEFAKRAQARQWTYDHAPGVKELLERIERLPRANEGDEPEGLP